MTRLVSRDTARPPITLNVGSRDGAIFPWTTSGECKLRLWPKALEDGHSPACVASDLVRARETAEAISQAVNVPVEVDRRLRECGFGEWQGLALAEVRERWSEGAASGWRRAPPRPGVSPIRAGTRVGGLIDELLSAHPSSDLLIVSHSGAIKMLIGHCLGIGIAACRRFRLAEGSLCGSITRQRGAGASAPSTGFLTEGEVDEGRRSAVGGARCTGCRERHAHRRVGASRAHRGCRSAGHRRRGHGVALETVARTPDRAAPWSQAASRSSACRRRRRSVRHSVPTPRMGASGGWSFQALTVRSGRNATRLPPNRSTSPPPSICSSMPAGAGCPSSPVLIRESDDYSRSSILPPQRWAHGAAPHGPPTRHATDPCPDGHRAPGERPVPVS